jgi:hypothetical protein
MRLDETSEGDLWVELASMRGAQADTPFRVEIIGKERSLHAELTCSIGQSFGPAARLGRLLGRDLVVLVSELPHRKTKPWT